MKRILLLGIIVLINLIQGGNTSYPGCGSKKDALLIQEETMIQSPGFENGEEYPANLKCYYEIIAPREKRIRLTFEYFDLEPSKLCKADRLSIFDYKRPYGVFCGSQTPADIISKDTTLLLKFKTDLVGSARGFSIKVRFVDRYFQSVCSERQFQCSNKKCVEESQKCDGQDDCGDVSDEEICGYRKIPVSKLNDLESICGRPAIDPTFNNLGRIVGGDGATPHSWPWQVTLEDRLFEPSGAICGGSLLNEQWVLTAAHCAEEIYSPKHWRIVLGNHDLFVKEPGEQTRYIEWLKIHPSKTMYDIDNDLALIKLSYPINFTKSVMPVCLPPSGFELTSSDECYATGWGETRGTGYSGQLKQVRVHILKAEDCAKVHPLIAEIFNPKTMICGGIQSGGHGVCHGDSGGPLVCRKDGKWIIVGVSSFATASNNLRGLCGLTEKPSAFSKVSANINWIRETIEYNS